MFSSIFKITAEWRRSILYENARVYAMQFYYVKENIVILINKNPKH